MSDDTTPRRQADEYRGLPRLLYSVRWSQHLLSIVAEVVILLSFAMSGMDVSLGGVMASVPLLKILWAGMFALGIDTAFALSWVRVRQCIVHRNWLALTWNMLLAVGMSVVIFEPISIQLMQQALNMDFSQAVTSLGINIVFLTYARAAVAVFLGAILAMTNVESEIVEQRQELSGPRRRVVLLDGLLNRIAPVISEEASPARGGNGDKTELQLPAPISVSEDISEQPTLKLPVVAMHVVAPVEQPVVRTEMTPQEREAQVRDLDISGLANAERVLKVGILFPEISDRELGKLSGVSAVTAKKYRSRATPAGT